MISMCHCPYTHTCIQGQEDAHRELGWIGKDRVNLRVLPYAVGDAAHRLPKGLYRKSVGLCTCTLIAMIQCAQFLARLRPRRLSTNVQAPISRSVQRRADVLSATLSACRRTRTGNRQCTLTKRADVHGNGCRKNNVLRVPTVLYVHGNACTEKKK
jgi:hypothetical protein